MVYLLRLRLEEKPIVDKFSLTLKNKVTFRINGGHLFYLTFARIECTQSN